MTIERRDFLFALAGTAAATTLNGNAHADTSGNALSRPNLSADPRRPQFHFLPAANWMNDPNGPIYWNGNYHMFYQYNPRCAFWADMHWGHAISKDMVHWKHLPIALSPTPGAPDSEGCFSGTAVVEDGRVLLFYTGVQSVAYGEATNKDGANTFREMEVADTVDQLRTQEESLQITSDDESNHRKLNSIRIRNCCGELLCKVRRSTTPFQISLTGSVDNVNPWLTWKYDPSNPNNVSIESHSIPISLRDNEELELHLYADGSVIEVCVNKQVAWTKRFYAKSDNPQDLCLNWSGRTTDIASLTVWQLAPISNDRLTT